MPVDLLQETKESLDAARKAVEATKLAGVVWPGPIEAALLALLEVSAQLARIAGVPNAVEPEPGAKPRVTETLSASVAEHIKTDDRR